MGGQRIPMRVILDSRAVRPSAVVRPGISIERDPFEYRGTAGVLKDLAKSYQPDDYLLVANAAQVLGSPLSRIMEELSAAKADVGIATNLDGTPGGFMLLRCRCLDEIPDAGFVDMKEQGLAAIARRHSVSVVEREQPTGFPIRTLGDYVRALRTHRISDDPSIEEWQNAFSIVESAADVHLPARIHDSVILGGGKVNTGAVVVRSIVCPGGIVRRGEVVIDEVVGPAQRR
jgi:hypothetical protein